MIFMKRVFIVLMCLHSSLINTMARPTKTRLTETSSTSTSFTIDVGSYELQPVIVNGISYVVPRMTDAANIMASGEPDLPVITRNVMISDSGDITIRFHLGDFVDIPNIKIAPSRGSISRKVDPATVPYVFGTAYLSQGYPEQGVTHGNPFILRDYRGVSIRICPFRYNAVTETLRVYQSVTVSVMAKGSNGINCLRKSAVSQHSRSFDSVYSSRFINYSPTKTRYTTLDDEGSLLIIAPSNYLATMQPLVNWKRQKGIPTEMVDLADIGSTATDVLSYVQNYYDTNGLTFLLLVGDADIMPYLIAGSGDARGVSDPSYSKLAGSDNYPDIFVGRFSVESTEQLQTMVTRNIEYERNPVIGGEGYTRGFAIASNEEGDLGKDREFMETIRTNLLANGYSQVSAIYDYDNTSATAAQAAMAVNGGTGLGNYVGHGDTRKWVTTAFDNNDVNALTNTTYWPFIFDVACVNGEFTNGTCFAEAWTRASHNAAPSGAINIYASTINQDWVPPMIAQREFNRLLLTDELTTFGGLCFNASMKMMDEYASSGLNMFNTWTVFGDPSQEVRTAIPFSLDVSHRMISSTSALITVSGRTNALAALSCSNTLLASGRTDSSGQVQLNIPAYTSENLCLTVTDQNAIPCISTIQVAQVQFDVTPASLSQELTAPTSTQTIFSLSNSNGESRAITYTTSISHALASDRSRSTIRDVTGCEITISPMTLSLSSNTVLSITVTNRSPDKEWLTNAVIKVPTGLSVISATKLIENSWGLDYTGDSGDGAVAVWTDTSNGSIEHSATGTMTVHVSSEAPEILPFCWTLQGDVYGDDPHSITGMIELTTTRPTPSLQFTSPTTTDFWEIGSTQALSWQSSLITQTLSLVRSDDQGSTWATVAENIPSTQTTMPWIVTKPAADSLFRIQTSDGSTAETSTAMHIVHPLTWLKLSAASGTISANQTSNLTATVNSTGLDSGIYNALLSIQPSAGNRAEIPVTLTVSADTTWHINVIAGNNGYVTPSGAIDVPNGHSTQFVITADTGYFIASAQSNGTDIIGAPGMPVWASLWKNVTSTGLLTTTFSDITATSNTPYTWLRQYYTNASTLAELNTFASDDSDHDGAPGWSEYLALTDPTSAQSHFEMLYPDAAINVFAWTAEPGRTYALQGSTDLALPFDVLISNITVQTSGEISVTDTVQRAETMFYRLKVTLPE
ncbi:MAG: hypothetical protein EOL87_01430 [Spartobacteria bacterium]|nr:hypothetical protein [Spartobacteria bacterium]